MPSGIYKHKPHSEETKSKLAENMRIQWATGKIKGHLGWNKGIPTSEETKQKISEALKGEKSPAWKGNNAGYKTIHKWVSKNLGKPDTCEHCGRSNLSGYFIDWANKSRKYKRDLTDWLRLCKPCHKVYDRQPI